MNHEEMRKLLGGYATGNLTPEQEQALCEAALQDQQLFEALAEEQPLRDLLADPAAREQILAAMDRPSARRRIPWLVPAGVLAMAAAATVAVLIFRPAARQPRPEQIVAEVHPPTAPPLAPAAVAPPEPVQNAPVRKKIVRAKPPAAVPPLAQTAPERAPEFAPKAPPAQAKAMAGLGGAQPSQNLAVDEVKAAAPTAGHPTAVAPVVAGFRESDSAAVPARAQEQGVSFATPAASPVQGLLQAAGRNLKVTVLRRQPDGSYSESSPAQLHAGDFVVLRITPAIDGRLTITQNSGKQAETLVNAEPVEHGKPFELYLANEKPQVRMLRVQVLAPEQDAAKRNLEVLRARAEVAPSVETVMLVYR